MSSLEMITNMFDPDWITGYSELKKQFRTGDVILVHGRYPFSWLIELLQGSQWGHSAMIVRAEDIDPDGAMGLPELMIWEANILMEGSAKNLWLRDGEEPYFKEGPMLVSLEERLQHTQREYKKVRIAYKPLHREAPLSLENLPDLFSSVIDKIFPSDQEIISSIYLGRTRNRVSNCPADFVDMDVNYDTGKIRSIALENKGMIADLSKVDINKDKIYCSELLAMTYKKLGLLTGHHVSNAYAPKDFSKEGSTRLLNSAWLDAEIFLDMTR
jgi:hypothetical protein